MKGVFPEVARRNEFILPDCMIIKKRITIQNLYFIQNALMKPELIIQY
jgi:hypothetical protein